MSLILETNKCELSFVFTDSVILPNYDRVKTSQSKLSILESAGWNSLSFREQQVVSLVCLKYTSRMVASRLSISPETVATHMKHALKKLRFTSRIDLIIVFDNFEGLDLWRSKNLPEPLIFMKSEKKLEV